MPIQLGSAYGKVVIDSSGATRGVKESSNALKTLTSVSKTVATAIGAVSAEAVILKKALDLGRQGGEVIQTAESFDTLLESVGAAPTTLKELQIASRGTVSDMKLMTSTATLLAGTQGQLATALANSTPELLEIAKAAQKLNPSLGDTTFLYDSLARGIKRASPLILDNLGIIVKVGEANETYAKMLGKSADALTAEEQKLALLNATLKAGRVLVDQAGASTESATDSFDRLNASMENISNEAKARLVPILSDAATTLELLVTWNKRINEGLADQEKRVRETADSWDEYIDIMLASNVAAGKMTKADADVIRAMIDARRTIDGQKLSYQDLLHEQLQQLVVSGELTNAEAIQTEKRLKNVDSLSKLINSLGLRTEAESEALQISKDYVESEHERWRLSRYVTEATQEEGEADEEAARAAAEHAQELREMSRQAREAAEASREAASDVSRFLDSVDRDLGSPLESFIKDLQWLIAGGAVYQQIFDQIKAAMNEGKITPEEAKAFTEELFVALQKGLMEAGLQTKEEAARNIEDALGIPIGEANKKLDELTSGLDAATEVQREIGIEIAVDDRAKVIEFTEQGLYENEVESTITPIDSDDVMEYAREDSHRNMIISTIEPLDDQGVIEWSRKDHTVTIKVKYNVQKIQSLEGVDVPGAGGQHGLNMIVPPGYPNDSFPVLASSGERVLIIPQSKRALLESPTAGMEMLPLAGSGPGISGGAFGSAVGGAQAGGGAEGDIFVDESTYVEQHFYDEGSAALGMAIPFAERRRRFRSSLGIGS
jgi:polyhydroxyalkanoate synthesis regulator phasin